MLGSSYYSQFTDDEIEVQRGSKIKHNSSLKLSNPWPGLLHRLYTAQLGHLKEIIHVFIFGCVGSSLLCVFFSSCDKLGLLSSCGVTAFVGEHGLSVCVLQ